MGSSLTKSAALKPGARAVLDVKVEQSLSALKEARRLVGLRSYGPNLKQIVARTYDLFEEIDELLLALNPTKEHDAFAIVAALHRRFEEIQSLIPRAERRN